MQAMNEKTNEFNSHEFEQYNVLSLKSGREAIGVISMLLHFDQRFKSIDYSLVINEIYSIVMNDSYTIIARNNPEDNSSTPVAVLGWGNFNIQTLALRANNIRPLSPYEYNSGDKTLITLFSCPFDTPEGILEYTRAKSNKLQQKDSITFLQNTFTHGIVV